MSLIINKSEIVFELAGVLNETNTADLKKIITKGLKKFDKLIICIEDVESMDRCGVDAITKLHYHAINCDKRLVIIGNGCKELYDHFTTSEIAA